MSSCCRLPTLREFLACSASWNACATAMHVHVNTVRYRIRRIEELTAGTCPRSATRWISSSPCRFANFDRVVVIRAASAADAAQVAAVMRASWQAAYEGIIEPAALSRATAPDGGERIRQSFWTRPWQHMLAATAPQSADAADAADAAGGSGGSGGGIVGYATFGPELDVLDRSWPYPLTAAGSAGEVAELYALYVDPGWWSSGTGRALMTSVLAAVRAAGYTEITLWVLEANARARRFYQRAGFAADGARHDLPDLGGVTEIRYRRPLSP